MVRRITKLQVFTILLFSGYLVWEVAVHFWSKNLPLADPIIRVDLILIYPILMIFLIVSAVQILKK